MAASWDSYGRKGIDIAHKVSSFGFSAAKFGTKLGFSVARTLASTAVGLTTGVVDIALFGGGPVTRPLFGLAVTTVLTVAEQITLAPIHLSEYITSTSLLAAHSSINVLSVIFPGSSDASFSLASFIGLVRREWALMDNGTMPEKQYGITQVARAVVGWVALQGVTQEWQEKRWFKHLKELDVMDAPKTQRSLKHKTSRIRVTSDVIFPGQQGQGHQIIAADIGDPEAHRSRPYMTRTKSHISLHRHRAASSLSMSMSMSTDLGPVDALLPMKCSPVPISNAELKVTLRRLSKMVLAGYGGASLLFFGVSPSVFDGHHGKKKTAPAPASAEAAIDREKTAEEAQLAHAIDAAEAEAAGDGEIPELPGGKQEYSWWDVLLGKHDQEIFETYATADSAKQAETAKKRVNKSNMKSTAVIGNEHLMPRFWVLTDYDRGEVVLVIRGTMSLNEIAVDLTCDPELFQPAETSSPTEEDETPVPGQFAFPTISEKEATEGDDARATAPKYYVHGGMARLAKAMGSVGKPVHLAVMEALHSHPDFDLIICGHSLGAGVAAILGLMWADPRTCQTVKSSGLPVGRQVQVYAFAPPTITDAALSRLSQKLIVSLVYSHDVVSRVSLGAVRDLRNAAMWLCEAEAGAGTEGWTAVTARAKRWKDSTGSKEDMDWFIAVRKTLEANMQNAFMYPPGRVLWAMRDGDLHPGHRLHVATKGAAGDRDAPEDKLRLFEVLDVEQVFSQIVFSRDMLTAHMPHQYDRVIHDLL